MVALRTAVCIATTGRADILIEALSHVARQSRLPDEVFICQVKADDVDRESVDRTGVQVRYLAFASGLTTQRNALLSAANDADVIIFIDDDFLMHATYVANALSNMHDLPDASILTGKVLADGVSGPGLSGSDGRAILASAHIAAINRTRPVYNAYGCNMVVNWRLLKARDCWFDENLPLYGWQEDVDFSRQAARYGIVYSCDDMVGVHLGVKSGRVSGVRFGYSQVANQIYLINKGTISARIALSKLCANLLANVFGLLLRRQSHVDRRGRVRGNLMALIDAIAGRVSPRRILDHI